MTILHLSDAFIQNNFFCQYVCSLGIEPTTFELLMQCSTEPQEHLIQLPYTRNQYTKESRGLWQGLKKQKGLF